MKVAIVCDSTCDLGAEWLAAHSVTMVPLKVLFGDRTYLDWIDLTPDTFFDMLAQASDLPKTSQPSPAEFTAVYEALAAQGFDEVVSIHLSSALSGTVESATLAAATSRIPVRVIDTKIVTTGTALVVMAAVAERDRGGDADAVEAAARYVVENERLLFALGTLEYLVKGGRAGKAQGLAANLLNIKPVLTFNKDGIIEPFKKVRGTKTAITEIASEVAKDSQNRRVRLALFHSTSQELADELAVALDAAGADYELVLTGRVGAVIGTYAGPGAVGAVYYPEP
ncbi:MAG: DegV family protein [Anaerosomatales bacterium]|nr:DegV family protein [Anaerosomatales bacterium]